MAVKPQQEAVANLTVFSLMDLKIHNFMTITSPLCAYQVLPAVKLRQVS